MTRHTQFFILFGLGFLLGFLSYWLGSIAFFPETENSAGPFRILASSRTLRDCNQIQNITNKDNINIYCTIITRKEDHGVRYKVKSIVQVRTDDKKNAIISVKNKIKNKTEHITEADYCTGCIEQTTVNLNNISDLSEVSNTLINAISAVLQQEEDTIEEAVDDAYSIHKDKKKLEEKIANCEISKKSTINYTRKITPEEKIECRRDQLADMENDETRTRFFHSKVKRDLWYLASQGDPLDKSFFLSDYMAELNNPSFFNHDYFSVRSAIDTIEKYNDLRLTMHELGDNKLAALNSVSNQLPLYFYTNENTASGRQDRLFLESAWNRNFKERPFPSYYSLSRHSRANKKNRSNTTNTKGISAAQFRSIVNSPEFKRLYR